jgi:hypothetical protein
VIRLDHCYKARRARSDSDADSRNSCLSGAPVDRSWRKRGGGNSVSVPFSLVGEDDFLSYDCLSVASPILSDAQNNIVMIC